MSSRLKLVPHPDTPPRGARSIEVEVWAPSDGYVFLKYIVAPADGLVLPDYGLVRADGLWRSTCFELFVKVLGQATYREFNFAPLSAWNAYSFTDWRKGMAQLNLADPPHLVDSRIDDRRSVFPRRYELDVILGAELPEHRPLTMSLAAVLEEADGTLSYWALAHPPGEPNFHHPACFADELPPAASS